MAKYHAYPARTRAAVNADLNARDAGSPPAPDCRAQASHTPHVLSPTSTVGAVTAEYLGEGFTVTGKKRSTRKGTKRPAFSPVRTYHVDDVKA